MRDCAAQAAEYWLSVVLILIITFEISAVDVKAEKDLHKVWVVSFLPSSNLNSYSNKIFSYVVFMLMLADTGLLVCEDVADVQSIPSHLMILR